MPCDLPDVNVWLALADTQHVHHERARRYWEQEAAREVAFCRITMLALLRLGPNARVMRGAPVTPAEAWQAYRAFRSLPEVSFLEEPRQLEAHMAAWSERTGFPPRDWTDCYLAALAVSSNSRLVSFDHDFERFSGLDFLRLEL